MLNSHQYLVFPSSFLIKILYEFLISQLHSTCPGYFVLFNLSILLTGLFGKECYKTRNCAICVVHPIML